MNTHKLLVSSLWLKHHMHMGIVGKFLSCKLLSIISSLCILWIAKLLFPLKNSNKFLTQLGLQTLIHHPEPNQSPHPTQGARIVHRYSTLNLTQVSKRSSPLPSPMFRSSAMGDLIGAESGDNMSSNVDELKGPGQVDQSEEADYSKRSRVRYRNAMTKKYPPPITLLRQTGSLPGRMPWVYKREYSDGRLVIRAERYKRREYLEAHRENGRLIMRLVPADDTVYCDECGEPTTVDIDGEEEREFEDLEETEQVTEREERDDEEEVALASEASSFLSQKSCLEDESKHEPYGSGSLRKCFACAGGMGQDSDPLCKGNGIGVGGGLLGQPASAPIRPITAVT